MLEKDLWLKLKSSLGASWRAQRIENCIASDTPDVFYSIQRGAIRIKGMIELKCQEPNKSGKIIARHYTQGQRDFATLHHTFFLLHSGGFFMLFDYTLADEICRGQNLEWHKKAAMLTTDNIADKKDLLLNLLSEH